MIILEEVGWTSDIKEYKRTAMIKRPYHCGIAGVSGKVTNARILL